MGKGLSRPDVRPLAWAGATLGFGVGAFVDGIILHLVLQWHHLVSGWTDDPARILFWDGILHAGALAFTLVGVGLLWRAWTRPDVPRAPRVLVGTALAGWGVFNLVDSLLNHWILGTHHIWPEGPGGWLLWDLAFFASGVLLALFGWALARSDPAIAGAREGAGREHPLA